MEISQPYYSYTRCEARKVLNAFRHQWKFHAIVERHRDQTSRVLNAFRHQWKFHSRRPRNQRAVGRVLNAFRHQWKFHFEGQVLLALNNGADKCSTPFGINGNFTFEVKTIVVNDPLCSTPFGINGNFTR